MPSDKLRKVATLLAFKENPGEMAFKENEGRISDIQKLREELKSEIDSIPTFTQTDADWILGAIDKLSKEKADIKDVEAQIDNIARIPGRPGNNGKTPVKGKDYFTDKEIEQIKKDILSKIEVPEKIVEKVEVIREQPIVKTEVIKEITEDMAPEQIRDRLELLQGEDRLDAKAIKNLPEVTKNVLVGAAVGAVKGLVAGTGITITNASGQYPIIEASGASFTDEKVKLNASDPTAGYLDAKLDEGITDIRFNETTAPDSIADTLAQYAFDFHGVTIPRIINGNSETFDLAQDNFFIAQNITGDVLNVGDVVYITGSTGNVPTIAKAKADSESTMPVAGVVYQTIADNGFGRVMFTGLLSGFNTNSFTEGDILYVSDATAGTLTNTEPTHPSLSQRIGVVTVKGIGNGAILVRVGAENGTGYYDDAYLTLDQTTPQTVINGVPIFDLGVDITAGINGYKIGGDNVLRYLGTAGQENLILGTAGNSTMSGSDNLIANHDAGQALTTGQNNILIGGHAGKFLTVGSDNVAMGYDALGQLTDDVAAEESGNIAIGFDAMWNAVSDAYENVVIGRHSGEGFSSGHDNTYIGVKSGGDEYASGSAGDVIGSTGIGSRALNANYSGDYNTAIGFSSGELTSGDNNVFLGAFAGKYATGSNEFYLDALDRTNTAGDVAGALLYGTFDSTPANQTLRINANLKFANYTTDGFIKTSSSDGTLSIDTNTYLTAESDTLSTVTGRGATTATTSEFQNALGIVLGKDDATNTAGQLKLWSAGANNYYTTITAGTQTATATYTLPTAMPATLNNQVLMSSTTGAMSWSTVAYPTSITDTRIPVATATNTIGSDAGLTYDDSTDILSVTSVINATTGYRVNNAATSGKFLQGNGTNFIVSAYTLPTSASGSAGKVLQSDNTNYVASTITFPTSITQYYVPFATAANTIGSDAGFTYNSATDILTLNGDIVINADSKALKLGAGGDASITFDGNSLNINTNLVGATDTLDITSYLVNMSADLDVVDTITAGDIVIDEAAGVLNFTGATGASITASAATLTLDPTDSLIDLSTSLVAHWKMNDNAANTTIVDNINSYNGTAQRNTSTLSVAGKINTAINFASASSDYVTVADNSNFDFGSGDFTIAFWVYAGYTGAGSYWICRDNTDYPGFLFYGNAVYMSSNGSSWDVASNKTFGTGSGWHHFVVTRSGNNFTTYKDTVSQTTWSSSATLYDSSNSLYMGTGQGNYSYFNGYLDDVRIYKGRALNATEIAAIYNSGDGTENDTTTGTSASTIATSSFVIGEGSAGKDYSLTFNGETNDGIVAWMEDEDYFQFSDDIMLSGGENIVLSTSTGTKIGTATNQLLGFYNATPVDQPATVADPSGGGTVDAEARTAINAIIDRLQELGLIA